MEKCRVLELIGGSLTDGGAETLVKEYMIYLNDVSGGNMDVGSTFYEDLKQKYDVTEYTEVTGPLRIGYVTIN